MLNNAIIILLVLLKILACDWSSDLGLLRDDYLNRFFKMVASCVCQSDRQRNK